MARCAQQRGCDVDDEPKAWTATLRTTLTGRSSTRLRTSMALERHWAARRGKRGGVRPCRWGWGCTRWCPSRDVPGTGAPGCTGVRLYTVGRRTHVLGARSVHHPVSSRLSVSSGHRLELRVSPPSATRILPSGLSPSVPEFHRLSRRTLGRLRQLWCERVADCDRRFGLSPTPEYSCAIVPPTGAPCEAYPL